LHVSVNKLVHSISLLFPQDQALVKAKTFSQGHIDAVYVRSAHTYSSIA